MNNQMHAQKRMGAPIGCAAQTVTPGCPVLPHSAVGRHLMYLYRHFTVISDICK